MNKTIDEIIEYCKEQIETEKENYKDSIKYGGCNCAAGMASGAREAYEMVIDFIKGEE